MLEISQSKCTNEITPRFELGDAAASSFPDSSFDVIISRPTSSGPCWARCGLFATGTGEVGGKETGQKMAHLIDEAGNFKRACQSLLASHPAILYSDRGLDENEIRKKKLACKTKYTCPSCGLNAWAKPNVSFLKRLACPQLTPSSLLELLVAIFPF
jgi:hypothetical protein